MGTGFGRRAADGTIEYHDSHESPVAWVVAHPRESSSWVLINSESRQVRLRTRAEGD